MMAAVLVALLLRTAVQHAAAQPSMPRPTELDLGTAAAHQLAGMEEAAPATTEPPYAAMRLLRRDEEITYSPNVCGFVSGSIDAAITCKVPSRTCQAVGTWLRCCTGTETQDCDGAIPTACINYADGGNAGCAGAGPSTTCCSEATRQFCESLVMTQSGSSVYNVVCGGRDRGTGLLELLATATNDPRLTTSGTTSESSTRSSSTSSADGESETGNESEGTGGESTVVAAAPETGGNEEKPVGAIVGGVFGGVAGLSLLLVGIWFLRKRQAKSDRTMSSSISRPVTAETRGPEPVYLPPQTLPDLPPESSAGPTSDVSDPTSPTNQSARYYYGGMPKTTGEAQAWNYTGSPDRDGHGMGRGM